MPQPARSVRPWVHEGTRDMDEPGEHSSLVDIKSARGDHPGADVITVGTAGLAKVALYEGSQRFFEPGCGKSPPGPVCVDLESPHERCCVWGRRHS